MNNTDNLRAFIKSGPFNLTAASNRIGIHPQILKDFMTKTYKTKDGPKPKGLGDFESQVFSFFRIYGYQDHVAYEAIL